MAAIPFKTDTRTIKEIVAMMKLPSNPGVKNPCDKLYYKSFNSVSDLSVDREYERMIDKVRIQTYGQYDNLLGVSAYLSLRPDGKYYFIDGQTHGCMFEVSKEDGITNTFHALIYDHPPNATLQECLETEAYIYTHVNKDRRTVTKLEDIRAGIHFGDKEALWILRVLQDMNIQCLHFGSDDPNALELTLFNQFYLMATKDFPNGPNELIRLKNIHSMKLALELYKRVFEGDKTFVTDKHILGVLLRGFGLIDDFMRDVLENGQRKSFDEYLVWDNFRHWTSAKQLKKIIGQDGFSPRRMLWEILRQFKIHCQNTRHEKRNHIPLERDAALWTKRASKFGQGKNKGVKYFPLEW